MARMTNAEARNLPPPTDRPNRILWDRDGTGGGQAVGGFGLRVTRQGARSFFLDYRIDGRKRRYTIGRFDTGAWSVAAAREAAQRLINEVDRGIDPLAEKSAARAAPTLRDLWTEFEQEYMPDLRASTRQTYRSLWDSYGGHLAAQKVAAITGRDIRRQHQKIKTETPYRANRWLALLSRMFTSANEWGWRSDNPCRGIRRAPEPPRERYLSADEITRLLVALQTYAAGGPWQEQSANAIRLLLLTGARRMEVLASTWEQFDLDAGTWTKPAATTKQKRAHTVPLSGPAVALLAGIEKRSRFVFPGRGTTSHQKDLKRAWATVTDLAAIENARLHDLRHTYASRLASAGQSLPIIGALLGHTQAQTTQRYAHLLDDPLRKATERVAGMILPTERPAEVRRLKK